MNILKRELRVGLKPFIFWTIGLFVLAFAGMTKFSGVEAGGIETVTKLLESFPRVLLAVLGMVGMDITTLSGYYAVLNYYSLICISIFAIYLGSNAVNRESFDKTYEFVFTKPRNRSFILLMKLEAGFIYLLAFSILNYLFSIASVATLGTTENINYEILLFTLSMWLVGLLFFSLAACFSGLVKRAEKGSLYSNLTFLAAFVIGIIYDMLENGGVLKFFSPLKYFIPSDILDKHFDPVFVALCIILSILLLALGLWGFNRKDLNAV